MPSFTAQVPDLLATGPVVEVYISPSPALIETMQQRKQTPPSPVKVMAMIDTGASCSVARPDVIEALAIKPIGLVKISIPSDHGFNCYQYEAMIVFPGNVAVKTSELIAAPLHGQPIQCLIGRDVLQHAIFIYNCYSQTITLSY
jgi:hypothetical protein